MPKKPKRPRDPNQLAKMIADIAVDDIPDDSGMIKNCKETAQQAGGIKGGKARAEKLSPEERKRIAQLGAQKRWSVENKQ